MIAGIAVMCVLIIAAIIAIVIIVIIRRRSSAPIAIRTEDVSGEMQQETDNFKGSSTNFNSTDNPIFAGVTSDNQILEDPFINDFEERGM